MRTLVISELFPPRVGGTSTWFYEVYRRYPAGDVVILTDFQPGDAAVDASYPFPIHRTAMKMADWGFVRWASITQYLRLVAVSWNLLRTYRIRTIHCGRVMPEGVVAYLLHRLTGTTYCVYAHGEEIGTAASSRQLAFLMRRVFGAARLIIANSDNTRCLLCRAGVSESRIAVLHPGVNTDQFCANVNPAAAREKLGLGRYKTILSVGRLQKRKGHDTVIKALPAVREAIPDTRYVIVGSGEGESRLRQLAAEQGVTNAVQFVGQVRADDLPAYYEACDVFVLPNREEAHGDLEGFGIVFLEASASAKPVIAGRSGGAREAVLDGETGLLVDGEDPSAVAKAIIDLLQDADMCRRMGERGRARTIEHFEWDHIAEQTRRLDASTARQ